MRVHWERGLEEQRATASHGLSAGWDMSFRRKEKGVAVLNSDHLLTSPIDFFSVLVHLHLNHHPRPSPNTKKWPTICLTEPLALISVPPTRMFSLLALSVFQSFILSPSCVGVWQNDRVEIIANDRPSILIVPGSSCTYLLFRG